MLRKLLHRPIGVTMALLSVVVLGLVCLHFLPVSLIPDIDIPYISVQVTESKLSARQMEESVVKPIVQQLMQIDEVKDISSVAKDGNGSVQLSFDYNSSIDLLFLEVNERLDKLMPSMPEGMQRPRVIKASASDLPLFYVEVSYRDESGGDFVALSNFATKVINRRIEQLDQVAMSDISGYDTPQITIVPKSEKLLSLGISLQEFENYIRNANIRLGSLSIRDGEYRYDVKFESFVSDIDGLKEIVIKIGDKLFRLSDLAEIRQESARQSGFVHHNGKRAISIAIIKQSDARLSDLRKSLEGLISEFKEDYPQLNFDITRDQSQLLSYTIRSLFINILLAVILSGVVILLFLGELKSSILVILVIPVSLISSILLFYLSGISVNILSLSGLILGMGMMVDNAIILIDNIAEKLKRDGDLLSSVVDGTKEVMGAMFSSMLTTCAVFVPVLFLSGIAGALFKEQALAVVIVLATSYLMTVVIIPVYYYCWHKFRRSKALSFKAYDIFSPLLKWERRVNKNTLKVSKFYIAFIAVALLGSIALLTFMKKERLPHITYSECFAEIDWNSQISVDVSRERVGRIESLLDSHERECTSYIGVQQYLLGHIPELSASQATVYIKCKSERELRRVKGEISDYIEKNYPGATCSFKEAGNIFNMTFMDDEPELVAKLRPYGGSSIGISELAQSVEKISQVVDADAHIATKKNLLFIADPATMALYNVSYNELLGTLKNALNGSTILEIVQGDKILPVVLSQRDRKLSKILSESYIIHDQVRLPLSVFLRESSSQDFRHIIGGADGEYFPITINTSGEKVSKTVEKIRKTVNDEGLFTVSFSGSWFSSKKLLFELLLALGVALLLLYIILAAQFNSLLQPFIILSEIVVDVFVVLLFMWILGVSVNIMSLIGLVVMSGIVINDSILKIDTINKLRDSGMSVDVAVEEAGIRRTKSIVMTSLTTILALLPFIGRGSIGDDLQYPLSIVIITGLAFGTLVSLFFVPSLYKILCNKKREG